jgi:hypothetical protein
MANIINPHFKYTLNLLYKLFQLVMLIFKHFFLSPSNINYFLIYTFYIINIYLTTFLLIYRTISIN